MRLSRKRLLTQVSSYRLQVVVISLWRSRTIGLERENDKVFAESTSIQLDWINNQQGQIENKDEEVLLRGAVGMRLHTDRYTTTEGLVWPPGWRPPLAGRCGDARSGDRSATDAVQQTQLSMKGNELYVYLYWERIPESNNHNGACIIGHAR